MSDIRISVPKNICQSCGGLVDKIVYVERKRVCNSCYRGIMATENVSVPPFCDNCLNLGTCTIPQRTEPLRNTEEYRCVHKKEG